MLLLVFILFSLLKENAAADVITPLFTEKHVLEGKDVTLKCNYTGNVRNLQWYRQYPGSKPEHLILFTESSPIPEPSLRLTAAADKAIKHMNLTISSTEVKDSAMYYCALVPTYGGGGNKIIFATGTKLIVETKETKEPVYYRHNGSCLATDFTNHKDVPSVFTPVRYTGKTYEKYYSSFAFKVEDKVCSEKDSECKGESSGQSDMELDEKINFVSLGLFWLRILLLKTVVFNILMTFKAWMS